MSSCTSRHGSWRCVRAIPSAPKPCSSWLARTSSLAGSSSSKWPAWTCERSEAAGAKKRQALGSDKRLAEVRSATKTQDLVVAGFSLRPSSRSCSKGARGKEEDTRHQTSIPHPSTPQGGQNEGQREDPDG